MPGILFFVRSNCAAYPHTICKRCAILVDERHPYVTNAIRHPTAQTRTHCSICGSVAHDFVVLSTHGYPDILLDTDELVRCMNAREVLEHVDVGNLSHEIKDFHAYFRWIADQLLTNKIMLLLSTLPAGENHVRRALEAATEKWLLLSEDSRKAVRISHLMRPEDRIQKWVIHSKSSFKQEISS